MANPTGSDPSKYFAAEPDSERCAANVIEKIRRYRQWLKDSGRATRMIRAWRTYHGYAPNGDGDTSNTSSSGEQGEYVDVTGNDFATLVTQTCVLTTQDKPAFKAIATNADSASMEQASFAQGLLEYYDKTHSLSARDYETVRIGGVASEGWEVLGWDGSAGKSLTDFVEGPKLNEGDIRVGSYTPFHVAYEPDANDDDSLEWFCFKRRYNRFNLAATLKDKNPKAAEKLLAMSGNNTLPGDETDDGFEMVARDSDTSSGATDLVWVWEFRHIPSSALEFGRLLLFASPECVVYDSMETVAGDDGTTIQDHGYPYDDLHAYRFAPDGVIGSIAGHTAAFDLLGLQEIKDTVLTMATTAANAGGISNLWNQTGDKVHVDSVVGAMNFLQSNTEPKPIQGVQLSAQVPALEQLIDKQMMRRLGQSDVSMGDVPKGMPGNLAALLDAKTVQYHSRAQACYALMLERSRTGILKILKRFAKTERVAVLGGKANGYKYKTWTAEDLQGVDRFVVEAVNPMTQTYSGKLDAAKDLLEHGAITPEQYLICRETGRLEPAFESGQSHQMRIRKEKEMMQEGVGLPPVDTLKSFEAGMPVFQDDGKPHIRPLLYDKHWEDIPEDLAVIAMPLVRDNPAIVTAVMGVVEERVRLLSQIKPVMLAVLGCPEAIVAAIQMQQGMAMGMPPPQPGQPSQTQPPKPGESGGTPPPKLPETPGLPPGAPRIAAVRPPPNPLTGAQAPSPVAP